MTIYNEYQVSIGLFAIQLAKGIEGPNDIVESVGTWSGVNAVAKYDVHVVRPDGTRYTIHIKTDMNYLEGLNHDKD